MKLPLRIQKFEESFSILDAAGTKVCYIHYDTDPTRREMLHRLSEGDAKAMAQRIARLLTEDAKKPAGPNEGTGGA